MKNEPNKLFARTAEVDARDRYLDSDNAIQRRGTGMPAISAQLLNLHANVNVTGLFSEELVR